VLLWVKSLLLPLSSPISSRVKMPYLQRSSPSSTLSMSSSYSALLSESCHCHPLCFDVTSGIFTAGVCIMRSVSALTSPSSSSASSGLVSLFFWCKGGSGWWLSNKWTEAVQIVRVFPQFLSSKKKWEKSDIFSEFFWDFD
jgi:hypothetical protein